MNKIKALSIVSPNGSRIADGRKTIEVRSWLPDINSGEELLIVENKNFLKNDEDSDPFGLAVATVQVSNTRPFVEADIAAACATRFADGYYSWELKNVRKLEHPFMVVAKRGLYEVDFHKPQENSYRPASDIDLPQICELMNSTFGVNPQVEDTFRSWIEKDSFAVFVATQNGEIIAVSACCVKTDIDLSKYESFGTEALAFLKDRNAGWFLSLAVKPTYRKLGIGRKLGEMQLQWLKLKNCTTLVGSSWQSGSLDNSEHLYRSAGFQKLGESQEYLRAQSQQTGFTCTVCKNECLCRSVLYGLELSL